MQIQLQSDASNTTGLATTDFQMKSNAHAFKILSSSLYENKPRAVLREIAANALDAHIASGCPEVPIKIQLPTEWSPELTIQDFGVGMTMETLKKLNSTYFASDKTGTNDLIGGFGLGSKSPFSLSDTFTVRSVKDGESSVIVAYVDGGVPKLTEISHEFDVTEANGTTVEIPISDSSVMAAIREEATTLFMYWDTKPDILNFNEFAHSQYNLNDKGVYTKIISVGWRGKAIISDSDMFGEVLVGNFIYKIPSTLLRDMVTNMGLGDKLNSLKKLTDSNTVLGFLPKADIGVIELAPSRERIEATKQNAEYLVNLFNDTVDYLVKDLDVALLNAYKYLADNIDTSSPTLGINVFKIQEYIDDMIDNGIDYEKAVVAFQLLKSNSSVLSDDLDTLKSKMQNLIPVKESNNYSSYCLASIKPNNSTNNSPVYEYFIDFPDILDTSRGINWNRAPLRDLIYGSIKKLVLKNDRVYRVDSYTEPFSRVAEGKNELFYVNSYDIPRKLKVAINKAIVNGDSIITLDNGKEVDLLGHSFIEIGSRPDNFEKVFSFLCATFPGKIHKLDLSVLEDFSSSYNGSSVRGKANRDSNKVIGNVTLNNGVVAKVFPYGNVTVDSLYSNADKLPSNTIVYCKTTRIVDTRILTVLTNMCESSNAPVLVVHFDTSQELRSKRFESFISKFPNVLENYEKSLKLVNKIVMDEHSKFDEVHALLTALDFVGINQFASSRLFYNMLSISPNLTPNEVYWYMVDRTNLYEDILSIRNFCTHRVFLKLIESVRLLQSTSIRNYIEYSPLESRFSLHNRTGLVVSQNYRKHQYNVFVQNKPSEELLWLNSQQSDLVKFSKNNGGCYSLLLSKQQKLTERSVFIVKRKLLRSGYET